MREMTCLYDLMLAEKAAIETIEKHEKRISSSQDILDKLDFSTQPHARENVRIALGAAYMDREMAWDSLKVVRGKIRDYFEELGFEVKEND